MASLSASSQRVAPAQIGAAGLASSNPQPYRAGGGVTAPRVISKVEPQYSREARLLKLQGTALLQAVIDTDGQVREVHVLRTPGYGLDVKAVEAVRQWRFEPGTKDGAPVRILAQVEINFRLR